MNFIKGERLPKFILYERWQSFFIDDMIVLTVGGE